MDEARKSSQPYSAAVPQPWGASLVDMQHEEALYAFGELTMFTLMWRPVDHEEGRVDRCPVCFGGTKARQAAAFEQATQKECPKCFGTTFEGGYRAQIIRPSLFADRNSEVVDAARGTVTIDSIRFETTGDFTLHKGDFVFRFDNSRYQVEEKGEDVIRDGFAGPRSGNSVAGSSTALREAETSMAFKIPPASALQIRSLLAKPGPFLVADISANDIVSPGGYL